MVQRSQAALLQQGVEFGHAVHPEEEYRRDIKRTRKCLGGRHRAIELTVKVLRGKAAQVHRHVRQ